MLLYKHLSTTGEFPMTTYQHFSIHGIGIRSVVTDSTPEPRKLWREEREIDSWSSVSNPAQCEEEWHLLWKKWCAFRKHTGTANGNVSPILPMRSMRSVGGDSVHLLLRICVILTIQKSVTSLQMKSIHS